MVQLEYSVGAKNVMSKFYRVDKMLYVEGDDDVPFWEFMFEKFEAAKVEVQQVGGKEKLHKYIEEIASGQLDAIVATDRDFGPFDETELDHELVVKTAGYSIENTLIDARVIMKVARKAGRLPAKDATIREFEGWLEEFYNCCSKLIINDLLDQCEGRRIGVVGDNCDRFMVSKNSADICSRKLDKYLEELGLETSPSLSCELEKRRGDLGLQLSDFIRGHFLTSAAHRFVCLFVKRKRSKIALSSAAFFGALNLAFESIFGPDHPHFLHYEQQFNKLRSVA